MKLTTAQLDKIQISPPATDIPSTITTKTETAKEREPRPEAKEAWGTKTAQRFINSKAGTVATLISPMTDVARGAGYAINYQFTTPEEKEKIEDSKNTQQRLYNVLLKKYKEARAQGDTVRQNRLRKVMANYGETNIMKEVYDEAPTTRQIVASAAEGALWALGAYKAYLPASGMGYLDKTTKAAYKSISAANKANKLKKLGTIGKVFHKWLIPPAKQGAIGSGFFGAMKARERDATADEIIHAMAVGFVVSGAITAGSIGAGEAMKWAQKTYGPKASTKWQKLMRDLEKTAAGTKLKQGETQIDHTLSYIGNNNTGPQKVAKKALGTIEWLKKIEMGLIDKFSGGKKVEARIRAIKGAPLAENEKFYRDLRLMKSVSNDQARVKIQDIIKPLQQYDDEMLEKGMAWAAQLDAIDRYKLGETLGGPWAGQNMDDLIVGAQRISQEIGPDDMAKAVDIQRNITNYNNSLLDLREESQLITKELKDLFVETHPHYIPHQIDDDILLKGDKMMVEYLKETPGVSKTELYRAIGSTANIKDPIKASITRTPVATRLSEKNRVLNNLVDAQEKYNLFPGMKKIEGNVTSKGYSKINLFRDGVKVSYQMPSDIAQAITNIDGNVTPKWLRLLTAPQRLLKKGATQLNVSFTFQNKFRDVQTSALNSEAFITDMAKTTGVSPKAVNLTKDDLVKLYKASGGYGSSIFYEGEDKIFKQLRKTGIAEKVQYTNPVKMITTINDKVEQSTRMNVFKRALESGLSPKDAAFVSRNATVDFAKMGTWMKPVNQIIPFLNARVQGLLNLPKAFMANPEVFSRIQMYTGVYPTLGLYQHNRRFDSYSNISQYMKDKYWIIMTGETDGVDKYTGDTIKVPQFITIAKGEGQSLVSNPVQWYLEKADGRDYRKVSEMLSDTLGSASPIEFQTYQGGNILLTLAGQFGPVGTIGAGLISNKVPYSGSAIVPERTLNADPEVQYTDYTSEFSKNVSKAIRSIPLADRIPLIKDLGSPAKLDFVLNSFGGLPTDIMDSLDLVYNVVRNGKIGSNSISDTPFGSLTQVPVVRRFFRESAEKGAEKEKEYDRVKEIEGEYDTEKIKMYNKAEDIWREMSRKKTSEEKVNLLNSYGDELTPEIRKRILYLQESRGKTVDALRTTTPIEVRARVIMEKLDEMEDPAERAKYIRELKDKGIMTDSVTEKIIELRNS